MSSRNDGKGVFKSNVPIFHTNCAKVLHFSAFFHYTCNVFIIKVMLRF